MGHQILTHQDLHLLREILTKGPTMSTTRDQAQRLTTLEEHGLVKQVANDWAATGKSLDILPDVNFTSHNS